MAWNPTKAEMNSCSTFAGILLYGNLKGIHKNLRILNIYGPYQNRKIFWDQLALFSFLDDSYFILSILWGVYQSISFSFYQSFHFIIKGIMGSWKLIRSIS